MAEFFGNSKCHVNHLALNEIEFDFVSFTTTVASLKNC